MNFRGNQLTIFVQGRVTLLLYFGILAENLKFKQMRKNLHIGGDYLGIRHQPDGQRRAQIILEGISGIQRKFFRIQTTGEKFAYRVRVGGYGTQANARVPTIIPQSAPLVNSKIKKKSLNWLFFSY